MKRKKISFMYDGQKLILPYYIHTTHQKAPTIVITGGMHGDEVNGIHVASELYKYLVDYAKQGLILGNIIIIPVLNIPGFKLMERYIPLDGKDLNRSFGRRYPKSFTETYATFLEQQFFSKADFGIDIHDAGGRSILYPHTRIHLCDNDHCERCSREMGILFGSKILLARKTKRGMLSGHMQKKYGKPFITLEVGGGQTINTSFCNRALRGIVNILSFYNFLDCPVIYHDKKQYVLIERNYYTAKYGGILDLRTRVGKKVMKGDILGTIYYPTIDRTDQIIAQDEGFVFSLWSVHQIPAKKKILSILVLGSADDGTRTGGVLG